MNSDHRGVNIRAIGDHVGFHLGEDLIAPPKLRRAEVPSKGATDAMVVNDVDFVLLIHSALDGVLVR